MIEIEMGNRGSKSGFLPNLVKEQRVDGNWCVVKQITTHLRCILMGFERSYQISTCTNLLYTRNFSSFNSLSQANNQNSDSSSPKGNRKLNPILSYLDVVADKSRLLSENKGKPGIYLWIHNESGKIYVGSAVDLSNRLNDYLRLSYLKDKKKVNSHIYSAIKFHGYSAFSLMILEYIDISNLSVDEAKILILEREQHFLDSLQPEYNILKKAGSMLGFKHSEESKEKLSKAFSGENHPMHGKTHSEETISKISVALSGDNHHRAMLGKTHSTETLLKMSESKMGANNPMFGKTHSEETISKLSIIKSGENHPLFGISPSDSSIAKMSAAKGGTFIYVYNSDKSLVHSFPSARKAAEFFNSDHNTIKRYALNGKIFKDNWIISTILFTQDDVSPESNN